MKYPKYLYRGTTTNYIGPLGMINVDPDSNRIYFSDTKNGEALDLMMIYSKIHRDPIGALGEGFGISFLAGGRQVIVTIEIDSDLARKLHRGSEMPEFEWWVEGKFIPRKNIVKIEPMWRPSVPLGLF